MLTQNQFDIDPHPGREMREYLDRLTGILAGTAQQLRALGPLPADIDVSALAAFWRRLPSIRPDLAADQFRDIFASDTGTMREAILRTLKPAETALAQWLATAGGEAQRRAGYFPSVIFGQMSWIQKNAVDGSPLPCMIGSLSQLPAGHFLKTALPPEDRYPTEDQQGALLCGVGVLNQMFGTVSPQPLYDLQSALALTRGHMEADRNKRRADEERYQAEKARGEREAADRHAANIVVDTLRRVGMDVVPTVAK